MIDSRAWDPNWEYRDEYNNYTGLFRKIWPMAGIGSENNATTVASGVSYYWGEPGRGLPNSLSALTTLGVTLAMPAFELGRLVQQYVNRIVNFQRLGPRGFDARRALGNF